MSVWRREWCPHCGTTWLYDARPDGTHTGWEGFLMRNIYSHWRMCEKRTPEERLEWAKRTQKRLARKPNDHTELIFNFKHHGMKVKEA